MIRISHKSIPQEYLGFINSFKGKMQRWLDTGSMGRGETELAVCEECGILFRFLLRGDNLKKLLLLPADDMPGFIEWVETRFPVLAGDKSRGDESRSDLYHCLYKAFSALGYGDSNFPRYEINEALGVKACPYCNAEEIIVQRLDGGGIRIHNSELDHFYPRKLYPYLALCLYNLVPSGSLCNGVFFKHGKDSYAEKLINPFCLKDSSGFLFEIDIVRKGALDLSTFRRSCSIVTNVVLPELKSNESRFKIQKRYSTNDAMDFVKCVWAKHRMCGADAYRDYVAETSRLLGEEVSFEQVMELELQINPYDYNKKKYSKLAMDIWWQLERIRI